MQSLADKIESSRAEQITAKAWFLEQQHIKQALGPDLWKKLNHWLRDRSESINQTTTSRICVIECFGENKTTLRNTGTAHWLQLDYDKTVPCVWFTGSKRNGYFAFQVNEDGTGLKFYDPKRNIALFPDVVGEELLRVCA